MVSLRPAYSAAFVDTKLVTFAPLDPVELHHPGVGVGGQRR